MRVYLLAVINIVICFAFFQIVSSLTCLECDESKCKDPKLLGCRGGTVKDPCGCCTICAKLEGEECGGPWNIAGVCDKGLVCKAKSRIDPGICRRRNVIEKLPRCIRRNKYRHFHNTGFWHIRRIRRIRRKGRCRFQKTVFCTKSCRRCCTHSTTCNPDVFKYTLKRRCNNQRQLYAPRHLILKDQPDDNDIEEYTLETDIKG